MEIALIHGVFEELLELHQLIGAMRDRDLAKLSGAPGTDLLIVVVPSLGCCELK